jgi:CBS domain-containing protein
MRTELPVAAPAWTVSQAVQALTEHDVDRLAVCDGEHYVGVITEEDVVRLDDILDATGG